MDVFDCCGVPGDSIFYNDTGNEKSIPTHSGVSCQQIRVGGAEKWIFYSFPRRQKVNILFTRHGHRVTITAAAATIASIGTLVDRNANLNLRRVTWVVIYVVSLELKKKEVKKTRQSTEF